jgi:hypothetical protein
MVKINISKTNSPKNPHSVTNLILMNQWKITSTFYHARFKLIPLKLHNSHFYIVVITLHKLHRYKVSHMVNCMCYKSCNLFDSTHACRKYVELQMVVTIQIPNYKASCKSSHFFIMLLRITSNYYVHVWV